MRPIQARPLAVTLVLLAGLAGSPAQAEVAPVTEDGAKALAASLKDGLKRWFPQTKEGPSPAWGEPRVTPAGDHYDVAVPDLVIEEKDGTKVQIGTVVMALTPRDGGTYGVTATVPSSIAVTDAGKPAATITIGKQRFAGVWAPAYETLLSADAEYGDLSVKSAKADDGSITIGSVTLAGELKPDETKPNGAPTWSGPGAMSVSNVAVTDEKNRTILKLAGMTVESSYSRLDLARGVANQKMAQAHAAAGTTPKPAELLASMQGVLGGMDARLRLNGLTGTDPKDGTTFALNQLSTRTGVSDLDRPLSSASLGFEAQGLTITPAVAPPAFWPDKLDVQMSLAKVPSDALMQAFSELIASGEAEKPAETGTDKIKEKAKEKLAKPTPAKAAATPDATPAATPAAIGERLAASLSQAGSELRIDRLVVDTPATSGSVTGTVRAAVGTAFGGVGGVTVLLRGLDSAAKALQPKPGKKADKETQDALGMIAMLQAMGQVSKDEAGKDVRTYKIDLTETGQFLLNGADMTAMMGGGAPVEEDEEEEEPVPAPKKGAKKN